MNPHGMHDKKHKASAHEVCKLMSSAMEFDIVRHTCGDKDWNAVIYDKNF